MNLKKITRNLCCLGLIFIGFTSAFASDEQRLTRKKPDPKSLIGKEVMGNKYPDGWVLGSWANYEKEHSLVLLTKANSYAFVLEKPNLAGAKNISVIVDAVLLKGRPRKGVWYDMSTDCRGPTVPTVAETSAGNTRLLAEVSYKKCARYSKSILSAWLVNLEKHTISPHSSSGMRCGNTYLDSGEIPECKFIPKEW